MLLLLLVVVAFVLFVSVASPGIGGVEHCRGQDNKLFVERLQAMRLCAPGEIRACPDVRRHRIGLRD